MKEVCSKCADYKTCSMGKCVSRAIAGNYNLFIPPPETISECNDYKHPDIKVMIRSMR